MGAVKQRLSLSWLIFVLSIQLSLASQSGVFFASFETDELEINSSSQERILSATIQSSCVNKNCAFSSSLVGENFLSYYITLDPDARAVLNILIGTAGKQMELYLSTSPLQRTKTNIWLIPSDSYPNAIAPTIDAQGWQADLTVPPSDSSDRILKFAVQNASPQKTDLTFQINVVTSVEVDTDTRPWLLSVIGAAAAVLFLFAACCICCRIRRNMRRRRFRAEYEQRRSQRRRNPESIYQPVQPQSPHSSQQPQQNYPDQMPLQGPLSEWNFDYRFPQAVYESFTSPFAQKVCSICLSDMSANQSCRQLYCEHIFHSECVKAWLLSQMIKQNHCFCPNCNKNMTLVEERAPI